MARDGLGFLFALGGNLSKKRLKRLLHEEVLEGSLVFPGGCDSGTCVPAVPAPDPAVASAGAPSSSRRFLLHDEQAAMKDVAPAVADRGGVDVEPGRLASVHVEEDCAPLQFRRARCPAGPRAPPRRADGRA